MSKSLAAFSFVAFSLAFTTGAAAHQIWLEQGTGSSTVLNFGEFGENLRETSPGLLDKFGRPRATLVSTQGEKPLELQKTATGFTVAGRAAPGESIVAEDAFYPLYKMKLADRDGMGAYHPAARYVSGYAAQQPRLALDVVPTGRSGEFQVVYKGRPLPKAKVGVAVQSGWEKKAESDAQGLVRFDLPWQGNYVIEATHTDRTPGERATLAAGTGTGAGPAVEAYDSVSYVTSLTVALADGIAPIAAGPAAPAHK